MEPFAFFDLLDDGPPRRVLARVSFLDSDSGGRSRPASGKYRPNHNFGDAESRSFYVGQLEIAEGDAICPGQSRDVFITFLNGHGLGDLLRVGRRWRIQEGGRLVANAEVLEVVGEV